jgi:peptide/nickel transport system permease protein
MKIVAHLAKELTYTIFIVVGATLLVYMLTTSLTGPYPERGAAGFASSGQETSRGALAGYGIWIRDVARGDLGWSAVKNQRVAEIIRNGFRQTSWLVIGSILVSLLLAVPIGFLAALRKEAPLAIGLTLSSYLFSAIPVFLMGYLAYGVYEPRLWSHLNPSQRILHYFLPMFVLGVGDGTLGEMIKHTRETVTTVLQEPYMKAVVARNASIWRHLVRGSILQVISVLVSRFGYILGATLVVEYVFSLTGGIGYASYEALYAKDVPVILAVALFASMISSVLNLVYRISIVVLDPRTRFSR